MITRFTLLLLIAPLLLSGCARMHYALRQEGIDRIKYPHIRVRVLLTDKAVKVGAEGESMVRTWNVRNEKSAYYSTSSLAVRSRGSHLELLDHQGNIIEGALRKVVVVAEKKHWLYLDGKKFRGICEFYPNGRDSLYTVNVLHLEDYLRGVLPPEIGKRTAEEYEAIKAQAVAARTYALATKDKYPDKHYDLVNDILDQVYRGFEGERRDTDRAIKQTRGEVLTYDNRLIDAYYHSTCGGRTDNIEDVWQKPPQLYLRGVEDDTFCNWSKYYRWTEEFTSAKLLENVRSYLRRTGRSTHRLGSELRDLQIGGRSFGGRVQELHVVTNAGVVTIRQDETRWALGRHRIAQFSLRDI